MAYDFEATDPDEISVSEGDAVLVLDDQSEDWWMVKLLSSGREGNVPAQYVEVIPAYALSQLAPVHNPVQIDTTVPAPSPAPALPRSTPTPPAASSAPTSPPLKNSMGVVPPPQRPRASTAASQSSIPQEQEQESEPEEADEDRRAQIDADAAKAKRIHDAEQRRIMKAAEARDMRTAKGIHFADEVDSPSASRMPAPRPIPVPRTPDDLSGSPAPPEADRKTPSVPEVSKSDRKST